MLEVLDHVQTAFLVLGLCAKTIQKEGEGKERERDKWGDRQKKRGKFQNPL